MGVVREVDHRVGVASLPARRDEHFDCNRLRDIYRAIWRHYTHEMILKKIKQTRFIPVVSIFLLSHVSRVQESNAINQSSMLLFFVQNSDLRSQTPKGGFT